MLSKSHSLPSKKDRKAKKNPVLSDGGVPTLTEKYNKSDDLVSLVYVDIANGVSRSDCLEKLKQGLYGNRPYSPRQSASYYTAALDRFSIDCDIEAEKLRKMFYGRYESLLADAIEKGDIYNARGILDSMSRIFGVERKTPDTAIQINSDKENGITINFGFQKDDIDED